MMMQFISYFLHNAAILLQEPGAKLYQPEQEASGASS